METILFPFVAVPCLAAIVVSYLITDWRLAGAVAAGAAGLLILPGLVPALPLTVFLLPLLFGAAVGAVTSGILLYVQNDSNLWTRMTWATGITFLAGFGLLFTSAQG